MRADNRPIQFGISQLVFIFAIQNLLNHMLIVDARESESIDRALKKYKKKYEKAGILRQLRERQTFTKPSIRRRQTVLRAGYIENLKRELEG